MADVSNYKLFHLTIDNGAIKRHNYLKSMLEKTMNSIHEKLLPVSAAHWDYHVIHIIPSRIIPGIHLVVEEVGVGENFESNFIGQLNLEEIDSMLQIIGNEQKCETTVANGLRITIKYVE